MSVETKRSPWLALWMASIPVAGILALLLLVACVVRPAGAAEVGDVIEVRAVCKEQHQVEEQIDAAYQEQGYRQSNAIWDEYAADGQCYKMPHVRKAKVEAIGKRRDDFIDDNDGTVHIQAYKVNGVWTAVVLVLMEK